MLSKTSVKLRTINIVHYALALGAVALVTVITGGGWMELTQWVHQCWQRTTLLNIAFQGLRGLHSNTQSAT
jgi:hypothetical protein